ncbi:hypothetical protein I5677_05080 [Mobilitalea sibirica]|uniref:Cytoskeletal protein CcmA (Bactofilin family) n=1 Tax=Mobilitalea sibirica TaxID=1462919 RepID=A0A8J7GY26_9FIRM|nr:hypothetical protein [Mobilitalea sibirica]MBH1940269.1 hypothetical protein [Mobilitalea sibirica]
MQDFSLEGIGKINGGEFRTLNVEGVGSCSSGVKAENIYIEGVFNCSGEIEVEHLHCEGVADFTANIRAKRINVQGVVSVRRDAKIEAEEIICEGVIKAGGEISADFINAEGFIQAKEIFGDRIRINSHYHGKRIVNFFKREKSDIKLIEATTIELSDVTVSTVNGRDITIGPYCKIDHLDCNGTLFIDRTATVGNITGNYTMKN